MEITTEVLAEIKSAGWAFDYKDEFEGNRIYQACGPEGKHIVCRDFRVVDGGFVLHNPWKGEVVASFATFTEVRDYLDKNGKVPEVGANVWD